eukprot:2800787-Amphidinium_carterae.1
MFLEAQLPDVVAPIRAEPVPTGSIRDAPTRRFQQSPEFIVTRMQKRGSSQRARGLVTFNVWGNESNMCDAQWR